MVWTLQIKGPEAGDTEGFSWRINNSKIPRGYSVYDDIEQMK